jgi:hypothetical protein
VSVRILKIAVIAAPKRILPGLGDQRSRLPGRLHYCADLLLAVYQNLPQLRPHSGIAATIEDSRRLEPEFIRSLHRHTAGVRRSIDEWRFWFDSSYQPRVIGFTQKGTGSR